MLSNKRVPDGKQVERPFLFGGIAEDGAVLRVASPDSADALPPAVDADQGLAEVQRVRQFFPETWIWDEVMTDGEGRASLSVQAPDSITTWDLRAVALSPERGLGVSEAALRVFQPFFLQADLPYSVIRGEEFPVKVALCRPSAIMGQMRGQKNPRDLRWGQLRDEVEHFG